MGSNSSKHQSPRKTKALPLPAASTKQVPVTAIATTDNAVRASPRKNRPLSPEVQQAALVPLVAAGNNHAARRNDEVQPTVTSTDDVPATSMVDRGFTSDTIDHRPTAGIEQFNPAPSPVPRNDTGSRQEGMPQSVTKAPTHQASTPPVPASTPPDHKLPAEKHQIPTAPLVTPAKGAAARPPRKASIPTSFSTVLPTGVEPASLPTADDQDFMALRQKCPRFRVLIIGKANAGKTTMLQKMCNTDQSPVIRDRRGKVVDQSIIAPTEGRGIHDIDNELTFSSNEAFVFHDSPGFEAGSTKELDKVREFIANRAATRELKDQLHAIWYCLPVDGARPLANAEMTFFEQGTGRVPVVAIFTKYDGMILKEYNKLRFEHNVGKEKANRLATEQSEKLFMESEFYLKRVQGSKFPPARCLRTQAMHMKESNCGDLSKETLEALDSKKLQLLFVSVQQNNIVLSTGFAIKEFVAPALERGKPDFDTLGRELVFCYGHLFDKTDYGTAGGLRYEFQTRRRKYSENVLQVLEPAVPLLAGEGSTLLQLLRFGIATLILAEDSFWLKKDRTPEGALKLALVNYQESARLQAVISEVNDQFHQVPTQDLVTKRKEVVRIAQSIVRKFAAHP